MPPADGLATDHVEDALVLAHLAALAVDQIDAGPAIDGVDLSTEPAEAWAHRVINRTIDV